MRQALAEPVQSMPLTSPALCLTVQFERRVRDSPLDLEAVLKAEVARESARLLRRGRKQQRATPAHRDDEDRKGFALLPRTSPALCTQRWPTLPKNGCRCHAHTRVAGSEASNCMPGG